MAETIPEPDATTLEIRAALREAIKQLRAANVPSHSLAAELLLMHVLRRDRTWLYTHPEAGIEPLAVETYFALVARRAAGEPTQYLTGRQEFWGLEFEVTPAVLIPRPETEHVIEVALERLGDRSEPLCIADVGTGSGCIAIALACELPLAEVVATDISAAALEVAQRNATRHHVSDRIRLVACDLLSAVAGPGVGLVGAPIGSAWPTTGAVPAPAPAPTAGSPRAPFDLIISNPPYVSREEASKLPREVREHEPDVALFAGLAGIEICERLIDQADALLRPAGLLVLELGYNSEDRVRDILAAHPNWRDVRITNDLAGIPRVLATVRTGEPLPSRL
jgi:release factor glutamine methyltransferase